MNEIKLNFEYITQMFCKRFRSLQKSSEHGRKKKTDKEIKEEKKPPYK